MVTSWSDVAVYFPFPLKLEQICALRWRAFEHTTSLQEATFISVDIIIGFSQRRQTVIENNVVLSLDVHSLRQPELDYVLVFRHLQSSSTASVESFSTPTIHTHTDAQFGFWREDPNTGDNVLEDRHVLPAYTHELSNVLPTIILNDLIPEEEECYTVRILNPDTRGLREETFACTEDFESKTDFFCLHTICIEDNDG